MSTSNQTEKTSAKPAGTDPEQGRPPSTCCPPAEQRTCCEADAKAECCGNATAGSCGCR